MPVEEECACLSTDTVSVFFSSYFTSTKLRYQTN